jgi:hypothetical protein
MAGPAHGVVMTFPTDEPPAFVVFEQVPTLAEMIRLNLYAVKVQRFVYRCEVSNLDDGEIWVYVPLPDQE